MEPEGYNDRAVTYSDGEEAQCGEGVVQEETPDRD